MPSVKKPSTLTPCDPSVKEFKHPEQTSALFQVTRK